MDAVTTSSSSKRWIYDVFLSFRGVDTRKNFTDHLYIELTGEGINTFMDDVELQIGEEISSELLKAIEKSRIAIVVLSRNYATSRWCLKELVKIMECRTTVGQIVVPVFYDVDPSAVRHQNGSFADAFVKHEQRSVSEEAKAEVASWRLALTEVASLSRWYLRNVADGHEEIIKKIVGDIIKELNNTHLSVAVYPVGLNSRVQEMSSLLSIGSNEVFIVGICGMGGIGKSTIAKSIYNHLFYSFEGRSFLAKVRETSEQSHGLVRLQEQLLSHILKKGTTKISTVDKGVNMIRERLCNRRVLLILDDVDHLEQLYAIAGSRDWFGSGSRIIVTTRDEHLLKVLQVDKIYRAKEMNDSESLELFSWHAFRRSHPVEDYEDFSKDIVAYSGGLPLALEILGSDLFGRNITEWKSALDKLRKIPHHHIQDKLRISFDDLNYKERDIFLDIASFFVGMNKDYTVQILNGCGFSAETGLSALIQRGLVTVSETNKLMMHDLLREMGREIVRQESPNEPGRRSRLWHHADVVNILTNNMGTKEIHGLTLKLPKVNDMKVNANVFCKLQKLRLLQLNYVQLSGGCDCLLKELRWLCWHGFPLKFIPNNFYQANLVAIDMQYSNLRQVCRNSRLLEKLKFLNLSHSHHLSQTPDFSKLPLLEELKLKDCKRLVKVHCSIGLLNRLVLANFKDCEQLKSIPGSFWKLRTLEILNLSGCSKFDDLPEDLGDMESLTTFLADNTAIRQVPNSIGRLRNLKHLSLCGCRGSPSNSFRKLLWSLVSPGKNLNAGNLLPSTFQALTSLTTLSLRDCNLSDDAIPKDLGSLSSLRNLDLGGNSFCSLPFRLSDLLNLSGLKLDDCTRLQTIPDLPRSLDNFHASNCTSLERLPDVSELSHMHFLYVANCPKLMEAPGLHESKSITHIEMEGCHNIANACKESILKGCFAGVVLPGNEIPDWFNHVSAGSSVSFELPQFNDRDLEGLNVCILCSSRIKILKSKQMTMKFTNYTKGCSRPFRRVAINLVSSDEYHLWQGHVSSKSFEMGSNDKMEVAVDCKNTMIVKMIGVYVVYKKDDYCGYLVDPGKITDQYISGLKERNIAIADDERIGKDQTEVNADREFDNDDRSEKRTIAVNDDEELAMDEIGVNTTRGLNNYDGAGAGAGEEAGAGSGSSCDYEQEPRTSRLKNSSATGNKARWDGMKLANILCQCGRKASLKTFEYKENKHKWYYHCDEKDCEVGFIGWCLPTDDVNEIVGRKHQCNQQVDVNAIIGELQKLRGDVKMMADWFKTLKMIGIASLFSSAFVYVVLFIMAFMMNDN